MIRVCIFGTNAYGFDVTNYENLDAENDYYSNLLTEDLVERVSEGDVLMYFNSKESAKDWCEEHNFEYEFVEPDDCK